MPHYSRGVVVVRFAVVVFAVMVGPPGCGSGGSSTTSYVCQPACPTGTHCAADGCVRDGEPLDLAAPARDLTVGCSPACGGAAPYCNASNQCVPCLTDDHCPTGSVCRVSGASAACLPGCTGDDRCASGQRCCGGACVDPATDAANCGACGTQCMSTHAGAACQGGGCVAGACDTGWGDCNNDGADGCETNLRIDTASCGACGTVCRFPHAVAACSEGCYIAACDYGYDDCNGDPKDGCEASITADVRNCGGCGNACPGIRHGQVSCFVGVCRIQACTAGFTDCDGLYDTGCETATGTDVSNCGQCGNKCLQIQVCTAGACTCPMCSFPHAEAGCFNNVCAIAACNAGWGNCNNDPKDGCETDITGNAANCGVCGFACPQGLVCKLGGCTCPQCNIPNARTKCINNQCVLDTCLLGYADCDGNPANGCEVDTTSDPGSCGGCGRQCPQNQACALGQCTECGNQILDNNGILCVPKGQTYEISGDKCYASQVIVRGTLSVAPFDGNAGGSLVLRSPTILVEASGVITGDYAGGAGGLHAQNQGGHVGTGPNPGCGGGPGNSVGQGGAGGGYGGVGGKPKKWQNTADCDRCDNPTVAHCAGAGGPVGGTLDAADVDMGSGGGAGGNSSGCANSGGRGGAGGASILLLAKSLQIDGTVTSLGETPPQDNTCGYHPGGGGGSGGGVVLRAETLSGAGSLVADGGNGGPTDGSQGDWGWSGGGGGGGRVKVFASTDSYKGSLGAAGGKGGTTCKGGSCTVGAPGDDGTTYRSQSIPKDYAVLNCGGL